MCIVNDRDYKQRMLHLVLLRVIIVLRGLLRCLQVAHHRFDEQQPVRASVVEPVLCGSLQVHHRVYKDALVSRPALGPAEHLRT